MARLAGRRPPTTKEAWAAFAAAERAEAPEAMPLADYRAWAPRDRRAYDTARNAHHAQLGPYALGQTKRVLDDVAELIAANDLLPEERLRPAAAIDGEPTLGKTTLQRMIGRLHQRQRLREFGANTEDGHEYIPVCYVTLPRDSTIKGLNENIAAFYNLPLAKRENTNQLSHRVIDVMWRCGTELVLIDDLHFIQPRQLRGKELNDHLKYLMNNLAATFVVAGVGLEEAGFFTEGRSASQARLAQIGQRLRHFPIRQLEIDTADGLKEWVSLLRKIESELVLLGGTTTISDRDTARYIFERTGGSIGNVMEIVRIGTMRAIEQEAKSEPPPGLTRELLDSVTLSFTAEKRRPAKKSTKTRGRRAA